SAVAEPPPDAPPAGDLDYTLVCYRHPQRMTSLRCYNCNRPICIQCANKTPVGYICPECQRQAEDAFYNAKPSDYLIAAVVSLPISLVVGLLLVTLGRNMLFYLLIFFISGAVGSFIGRITKRAIGGRRGRYLPGLVVAMMFIGVLIPVLPLLLAILGGSAGALLALIGPGIYLFVGASAAYWQMR
ncbi:MAG: B-box zinc finger protein, partial [Candidatus Promineofilum sp.]|nr:B-box zinc finger protein [Promineifilum sp.]